MDRALIKEMISLSSSIFIVAIFDQVFWQGNQIILGVIWGTTVVAIYSVAVQIYMSYLPLATVFMNIFLPSVTEMVVTKHKLDELSNLFIKIGRIQFILLAFILSGFILYGQEFIQLWAGVAYADAYYIATIIMVPFTINLTQTMGIVILQARNQYRVRSLIYAIVGILNIIFAIPMAKYYGGIGCAIVTGICYVVGDGIVMNIYYSKSIGLNIREFWRQIGGIFIVVFCTSIIGLCIREILQLSSLGWLSIKLSIYAVIYMLMVWKFALNVYEKKFVLDAVNKLIAIRREKE